MSSKAGTDMAERITDAGNQSTCTFESDGQPSAVSSSGIAHIVAARSSGDDLRALLKVSPPMPVGQEVGRYRVRIWRKNKRQPFGIQFSSSHQMIEIAEDLPHLGLRQFDHVVSVNGMRVVSVEECLGILRDATLVDLVLQHTELEGPISGEAPSSSSSWFCGYQCKGERAPGASAGPIPLRTLLSASRPMQFSEDARELEVTIQRASLKQRFGVNFSAERALKGRSDRLIISIAEDLPHLGLVMGDQLLSVNGTLMQNSAECQRVLERSMTVRLRLKRLQGVEVRPGDDVDDDVDVCEEVIPTNNKPCGTVCG